MASKIHRGGWCRNRMNRPATASHTPSPPRWATPDAVVAGQNVQTQSLAIIALRESRRSTGR